MNIRQYLLTALVFVLCSTAASAEDWVPSRSIRLVIPFSPGGPTDALGRHLARALQQIVKQPVVVDNRAGAGGNIGAADVAAAKPDGYTILLATTPQLSINVSLYRTIAYDPIKNFEPVTLIGSLPNVLIVHPSIRSKTLADFVRDAKARPNEIFFASSGNGATSHLAGVLFNQKAGVELKHVPYRGTGPALNDLIAGHVQAAFTDVMTAQPYVKSGTLVAIGLTSRDRSVALPGVATLAEQGLDGIDVSVYFGVLTPKGTPPAVIQTLNRTIVQALAEPQLKRTLELQGIVPADYATPEYMADFMKREIGRWREIVIASGAQLD